MPIDLTTYSGQVRLLIPDTDPANQMFTDDEITTFLILEADSVWRAAAAALDVAASSEVMISKVIRTQDLSTDGARVAAELRARAATLRGQAASQANGSYYFDFTDRDYRLMSTIGGPYTFPLDLD